MLEVELGARLLVVSLEFALWYLIQKQRSQHCHGCCCSVMCWRKRCPVKLKNRKFVSLTKGNPAIA